jgi:fermentation-respiration switch protein FrsA (DUF1100 family)
VRALVGLAGLCLLLLAMATLWGRLVDSMIFLPSPGVDLRPEQLGVAAEEVFLRADDDVRIHAFFLPAEGADRAILFLHGNAGNASHRLPNAVALRDLGAHVLLLDYRGYGKSEGTPSEAGVYRDAGAGLSHLIDARQIPERRVVVFGRSIGAAVAVEAARRRALAGVILESPFTSISDVVSGLFGAAASALVRGRFDSASKIGELRAPLLFFHGDRDEIIDYRLGRRLFEQAPEPKAFETIQGAGHNDTTLVGGAAYFRRIGRFLDEVAP